MNEADLMIDVAGVHCRYGRQEVLRGVQLTVRRGEVYALLGGNGAGKSTLLHAILGFVPLAAGRIRVATIDVHADPGHARSRISYVPENVALYEQLSARENLRYLLSLAKAEAAPARIDAALDEVGFDGQARDRRLGSYSKGMRQRVALALAIARQAPVLLLDEPSSGLDPRATAELNALIVRLRQRGVAILMATHDLLAAAEVADRVGFMRDGVLVEDLAAAQGGRHDARTLQERFASAVSP